MKIQSIAIIGGGFSGICTVIHLIEKAEHPIVITLIEKESELCKGIAYKTQSPFHPLNVSAGKMGALSHQPNHFFNWLNSYPESWRHKDPSFEELIITPDSYVPRKLYAIYLLDCFHHSLEKAKKKKISCTVIHDFAEDVNLVSETKFEIKLSKNRPLIVDNVVLAVGVPSNQSFPFEERLDDSHYISNFWDFKVDDYLQKQFLNGRGAGKTIAIIGSGLTAVDALFTLHSMNYQGNVRIISKSGHFPQVHLEEVLPPWFHFNSRALPIRLLDYLRLFKEQMKEIIDSGLDWRQLVDAYRNIVESIWQGLSLFEKKQFMRHLFALWNKHRHRMSQGSYQILDSFIKGQTLILSRGTIKNVTLSSHGKLQIEYITNNKVKQFEADCLINCSGPEYTIEQSSSLLIKNLLKKEIVEPDKMGLGLKVIEKEILAGKGQGNIFGIGAILFGERLETTAVPDLREQANSIADFILEKNKNQKL